MNFKRVCGLLLGVVALNRFAAESLVYKTPRGVEFEISADGLSAIRVGERVLARGGWAAFNAEQWFLKSPGPVKVGKTVEKRFEKIDETHARVTHTGGDLACVYDYSFAGEDVTISARVENRHETAAMDVTGFSGLEFTFTKPPQGVMNEQHITYFQAHGIRLCHPSEYSPIGGSYAQDGVAGVGVSPWRTGLMRTLILWDYTDWNQGQREKRPSRKLIYFAASPIPARGAQTFDLRLRASPDCDWHHLLEPYREHFTATFGPVQYKADPRWIATDYLNESKAAIKADNPYGFHADFRRIDTVLGMAKFCDLVVTAVRGSNGQGIILWGQGGEDPRGGMYRPDFDVLPPEVEAQWGMLTQRLHGSKTKLGVCTRPGEIALKRDWEHDQIVPICADDPAHRAMLWARYEKMIERGCTLFYLDSFGSSFEDVKLMRFLREKMGPEVLTFCEHQCDAIMPFSGGYSEATLNAEVTPLHYRLWSGLDRWEIYSWLAPGSQMTARLYEKKGEPPADMETPEHWMLTHHITPLLPVNDFERAPALAALQMQMLPNKAQMKAWEEEMAKAKRDHEKLLEELRLKAERQKKEEEREKAKAEKGL
ncbi:MAG TPA: hypothetical protein VKX17_22185 [Planctomycetota bacterium]|nr:hypothetical protein [Planctomycetota bacterium]